MTYVASEAVAESTSGWVSSAPGTTLSTTKPSQPLAMYTYTSIVLDHAVEISEAPIKEPQHIHAIKHGLFDLVVGRALGRPYIQLDSVNVITACLKQDPALPLPEVLLEGVRSTCANFCNDHALLGAVDLLS